MAGVLFAALVLAPVHASAQGHVPPGILLRGTVVTMDTAHTVVTDGNVLIRQGRIAAIWAGPRTPNRVDVQNVRTVSAGPDGLIFPGLINLHDHPDRGMLPLWLPPASHVQADDGRPLGTEPYANRSQWGKDSPDEFVRLVRGPYTDLSDQQGLRNDAIKYTEARAALAGVTAIQGAETQALPIRNVDDENFGRDRVEDWVPNVNEMTADEAALIRVSMDLGVLDAWLVHLAEGVRDGSRRRGDEVSSRHEFDVIKQHRLLTDATVVVHGTGLEREDFAEMRAVGRGVTADGLGAKLVWSPLSNLLLYGVTTEVYDALAEDVTVSLGTDWSPSGSNTLLDELKVADIALRDQRALGDARSTVPALADEALLDRTLVDMVTRNPALTLRWPEVGTIATGKVADLLLLRRPALTPTGGMPDTPYRSLIDATSRDVALVLVGGDPIAGDVGKMAQLRGNDFDIAKSATMPAGKAVDVTPPNGGDSLAVLTKRLKDALLALCGANREPMQLRPLFTTDDDFLFAVLAPHVSRSGLVQDHTPPYSIYAANLNHVRGDGSLFAPPAFFNRWYRGLALAPAGPPVSASACKP